MKHIFILKDQPKYHSWFDSIQQYLIELEYEYYYTHSSKESQEVIYKLKEPCRIYICGGDGTISNILPAIINTVHEVVPIPLGTGNDFVRMAYSSKDPTEILLASFKLESTPIDLIQVNDHYCFNSICFGIDSIIANHVHDHKKLPLVPESMSYIVSLLREIFKFKGNDVEIYSNNTLLYKGKIIILACNNGAYYGGGFPMTPRAIINDGMMNLRIVDHISLIRVAYLLSLLFKKGVENKKEVHDFVLKEATIYSPLVNCNIDGDEYHSDSGYKLTICPNKINFVVQNLKINNIN